MVSNKIQTLSNQDLKFIEKLARSQMTLEAEKSKTFASFSQKSPLLYEKMDTCRKIIDAVQSQQPLNITMSTKW